MTQSNSPVLPKSAAIYVAGHHGMVGSAIVRRLQAEGYPRIITRTHPELDLIDQRAVKEFFRGEKIDAVFMAAARVGGIHANNTYRADFIYENLMVECNVIQAAFEYGVERLLFLGSSCIYPRSCPQPMREESAERLPGAHQRTVCGRQDRRNQALRVLQPAAWHTLPLGNAHQPLRAQRQFRSGELPRAPGYAAQVSSGEAGGAGGLGGNSA